MDDATRRQVDAARPDLSTWLSANAGSGKTRVLTDRVARLLLEDVDPQNILCLTYTKAAASEMQIRLFDRLGEWAMLDDDDLRAQLSRLGLEMNTGDLSLAKARRLFATAIETPGGLRIQTIHSFCASLLRRFPLEAGITPQFVEMDERTAEILRSDVIEDMARGPDAPLLHDLLRIYTGAEFDKLLQSILGKRDGFDAGVDLRELFNLPKNVTRDSIEASVFLGAEADIIATLLPVLRQGGPTDAATCERLSGLASLSFEALPVLDKLFLTQSGNAPFTAKIGKIPTKPLQKQVAHIMDGLNDWMRRVEGVREDRLALLALEKTQVLHAFARCFIKAYDAAKLRRGFMDFDDLIHKTRDLLTNPVVADWVLFRLDGGLDHILVDEAQDTGPAQWQVIMQLAQELTSGRGVDPDKQRTIFVVGDKKQSIYSFQGADPRAFDTMRDFFADRLETSGAPLVDSVLEHSFRSSSAILDVVDKTFSDAPDSGFAQDQSHIAFHTDLPGRVDLWPALPKPDKPEDPPWYLPVDIPTENDPAILLADTIAAQIKEMIDGKQPIPDAKAPGGWRPVTEGDFLILVQRRSFAIFHEVIRACKALKLGVAGADRLKLGGEIAVRDISALLSFLATPEDDLSLATALRSPLFGWSEQQLFALAQPRGKAYLWAALRDAAAENPETLGILDDLRAQADYMRPYDLIERILTRHSGRTRLLARLGPEAEDGIDALLAQALQFERNAVDSLTGFLVWMERDDIELKRELGTAGNLIRVMTVHGAKGLESPVVILPETQKRDGPPEDTLLTIDATTVWKPNKPELPPVLQTVRDANKNAELAERDRLLYVAMTRAEKWLIVAAAGDTGEGHDSWHSQIATGMASCNATDWPSPTGPGLRIEHGNWADTVPDIAPQADLVPPHLPAHFSRHAMIPDTPPRTLSPSDLPGAKALAGEAGRDTEDALREGAELHDLLERLPAIPRAHWSDIIATLGTDTGTGHVALARSLIDAPHLARLFAPDTLAEVPVSAALPELGGARIHGVIDRLVLADDHVLVVDYKTNAVVPDTPDTCPDGILRQMGAYRAAASQLYPDRRIDTAILWTATGALMPLPHDLVTEALANTHIP